MQGYPEDGNKREYLSGSEIAGDFEPAIFMVWKGREEASVSIVHLVWTDRCMFRTDLHPPGSYISRQTCVQSEAKTPARPRRLRQNVGGAA